MSRPVAVVTGTSSGIGAAITDTLLVNGWAVCGISRRAVTHDSAHYTHFTADLTNTNQIEQTVAAILERYPSDSSSETGGIRALVNNAGVGHFAPHEELSVTQLEELTKVNLLAPLALSRLLLRDLKQSKGSIINISSFSAHESSSFGAAYAATKAGLRHFGNSLFEECRKSGLKVVTISPDITRTPFYDSLSFAPEDDENAAITPQCVAQVVIDVLNQRAGTVTTEVVLRPQRILLKKGLRK
jgi:short-subunit dehydrogenase